jgi:hypothetical protein
MSKRKDTFGAIPDEGGAQLQAKKPLTPEELDHTTFKTGKYARYTPSKVAEFNPAYIVALYENVNPKRVSRALYEDCKADLANRRDAGEDYDLMSDMAEAFQNDFDLGWY